MLDTLGLLLIGAFLAGIWWLLSIQQKGKEEQTYKHSEKPVVERNTFVPMEDRVVPTHANYTNKMNDMIGNHNAEFIGPGDLEVVLPYDYYKGPYLPSEYGRPYWPSGSLESDYSYPGARNRYADNF